MDDVPYCFHYLLLTYLALAGINHLATYCPDQSPRPSAVRVLQTYKACGQAHFSSPSPSPFPLAHFFTSHLLPRQNFLFLSLSQLPNRRWRPNMKLCTRTPKISLHCRPLNKRGRATKRPPPSLLIIAVTNDNPTLEATSLCALVSLKKHERLLAVYYF